MKTERFTTQAKLSKSIYTIPPNTEFERAAENLLSKAIGVVEYNGKNIFLSSPLFFTVERCEDGFVLYSDFLNISGDGDTEEDALLDFKKNLVDLYEIYKKSDDAQLDKSAKEIKKRLSKLFQ